MKNLRYVTRLLHLFAGAWLGTFVYSPWASNPTFAAATRFVLLPLVGLTGLVLWKQAAFGRLVRRAEVFHAGR